MSEHAQPDQTVQGKPQRGRPSNRQANSKHPTPPDTEASANKPHNKKAISPEIAERFQRGIEQFYEHQAGISLKEAYHRTLQHFFQTGYEASEGRLVPILPPAEELPTLQQFRRWYKKQTFSRQAFLPSGKKAPSGVSSRTLLGNLMEQGFGPGSLYEIDAVTSDIQVVSSLNPRRILGQPTIYLIRDAFSQMIVGINISLERPHWHGAMLALENAAEEKPSFCQHYGVAITEAAWPTNHLPQALLVEDPGKFEGDFDTILDPLVSLLRIRIDNAFPFPHGWSKAIKRRDCPSAIRFISSLLNLLQESFQQGGLGYLTLRQVCRLVIFTVLDYNLKRSMDSYPLDDHMIADRLEPYPIDLWNWGIQNRFGQLRQMAPQMMHSILLPQGKAFVSNHEILFQGLSYRCSLPPEEFLSSRVMAENQQQVSVSYNPQLVDVIYLRLDDGQRLEPCFLAEQEQHFAGCAWQDFQPPLKSQHQKETSFPSPEPPESTHPPGSEETA